MSLIPLYRVLIGEIKTKYSLISSGINNGGDLSRDLLESLYESIRTEPFKIPQDDGNDLMHTFFNPDKEGA